MDDVLIDVDHVSKKYCRFLKESMYYGMSDVARNLLGQSSNSGTLRKNEFWSVDDVSFQVKRGETLGLVGANGSGKTTMLKMLNGIFWPDKGKITVRGRVGALIAVGAGFHPLLTGRENVYLNGAVLGMSKKEVDRKFDAIIDFSGIESFLDSPVKNYSSGMHVRLGFAIAVHSDCDILLMDEVLAVGDMKFQAKCMDKIQELGRQGVTKVFVSHSFDAVQKLCQRSVYLKQGKIRYYGDTTLALEEFRKDISAGEVVGDDNSRHGNRDVEIGKVELMTGEGIVKQVFKRGETCRIKISFDAKRPVQNPNFAVYAFDEHGYIFYVLETKKTGFNTGNINGQGEIIYTIDSLAWCTGSYLLSVACWDSNNHTVYDQHNKMYPLIVEKGSGIPHEWTLNIP